MSGSNKLGIKAFRMMTGEYVVGDVLELVEGMAGLLSKEAVVRDPLIFRISKGKEPLEFGVNFAPLVPLAEPGHTLNIPLTSIMFWIEKPHEESFRNGRQ